MIQPRTSSSKDAVLRASHASGASAANNFLPTKIGSGILAQQPLQKPGTVGNNMMSSTGKTHSVARLYQTAKELGQKSIELGQPVEGQTGDNAGAGPAAPKVNAQKSPGKTFKSQRNAQSLAQMTTLVGSGVRKLTMTKN